MRLYLLFVFLSFFFLCPTVKSKTYFWTKSSGDWENTNNYSPQGVPTIHDDVIIYNNISKEISISVHSPINVRSVFLCGATLNVYSSITIQDEMNVQQKGVFNLFSELNAQGATININERGSFNLCGFSRVQADLVEIQQNGTFVVMWDCKDLGLFQGISNDHEYQHQHQFSQSVFFDSYKIKKNQKRIFHDWWKDPTILSQQFADINIGELFGIQHLSSQEISLTIPSTNGYKQLSSNEHHQIINKVAKKVSQLTGGATVILASGYWISEKEQNSLIEEPVAVVSSFVNIDSKLVNSFLIIGKCLATELNQEAVLLKFVNQSFLISPFKEEFVSVENQKENYFELCNWLKL
ncbi:hypothetical protein M0813_01628 [Anaeramoeba flamelloides]|uniref:Uncharacterized protein n=1 Tax=Anaeramoeba flamelloides TaxID=1746091 RepID=A0AAV7Z6W4_9EUKA|nr:hypothetical protein M0812_18801 [Anaeramoeba flamelloides]KAJ6251857.1 hypothetical protein M0813_01628 [Anaeramoeba flamelloides]